MKRTEVEQKYKWAVEDVFPSDEAWEVAFDALAPKIDFAKYRGTLNTAEHLLSYFKEEEALAIDVMRVYLYAFLKHDEDVGNTKYMGYMGKMMGLMTKYSMETSFVTPELTALPEETLKAFAADERLQDYDYMLTRILAEKKYILSEAEERILAQTAEPMSVANDVFGMLDNAELNAPEIEYEGKKQTITNGLYSMIMSGKDRAKREEAFRLFYSAYGKILGTLATTYYGSIKKDIFYKNVRGYTSCLQKSLMGEDVDESVYRNLIKAVNDATPLMHRYMHVRKRVLGYDEMHMYDIYPSLVEDAELRLSYEEAFELVLKGLAPLGEEYISLLKKGRDEHWIDVCETEGKRSGAYSIGIYGCHPYVLLNYQPTTHDVFTIAHEMGHALHSYFSNSRQPYAKADYTLFVAEVASTVNEVLLLKYLLKTTEDKALKKYLLNYFMDMIRTTLFRQTQFAEFEEKAHEMAEAGEPLNKDNLSALYDGLNKKYITAAICIANKILSEGAPAIEKYFSFLSGGGSTDPVSLLKGAGADLTKEETFLAAMKEFEDTLNAFEAMI